MSPGNSNFTLDKLGMPVPNSAVDKLGEPVQRHIYFDLSIDSPPALKV
jgi:hypothetical protein